MKLLLSSDNYIYKYQGEYYGDTNGTPDFYERYLRVFDNLRIVARTKEVFEKPGKDFVLFDPKRIEVWPFPFFQGPIEFAKVYIKCQACLRGATEKCDAAILRLPSTTAFQVLYRIIAHKLPYAIEVVFDPYDSIKTAKKLTHKYYFWRWYKGLLKACKYADGISCVTREYLQQRYSPSKPGAFVSHYSSISLPESMYYHERKFPTSNKFVIGHVAAQVTFAGRKGHKELIDALALVKKEGLDISVQFVGEDYLNGIHKLKEYASTLGIDNNITFTGKLDTKQEVLDILRKCDIFVMPTKAEGLPRSIIEAMSQGLPCITTNVSGNPELVQKDFLIDDFYNVESLADTIIRLVKVPNLYESASQYNFDNCKEYSHQVLQDRRDEFFANLKTICMN